MLSAEPWQKRLNVFPGKVKANQHLPRLCVSTIGDTQTLRPTIPFVSPQHLLVLQEKRVPQMECLKKKSCMPKIIIWSGGKKNLCAASLHSCMKSDVSSVIGRVQFSGWIWLSVRSHWSLNLQQRELNKKFPKTKKVIRWQIINCSLLKICMETLQPTDLEPLLVRAAMHRLSLPAVAWWLGLKVGGAVITSADGYCAADEVEYNLRLCTSLLSKLA